MHVHIKPHDDHCENCRRADDKLGDPERKVAQADDRRDLHVLVVVDESERLLAEPSECISQRAAHEKHLSDDADKLPADLPSVWVHAVPSHPLWRERGVVVANGVANPHE